MCSLLCLLDSRNELLVWSPKNNSKYWHKRWIKRENHVLLEEWICCFSIEHRARPCHHHSRLFRANIVHARVSMHNQIFVGSDFFSILVNFFFPSLAFHHFDRLTCADLTSHDFRWMKFIIHKVNNIFGVNAMLSTLDFLSSCALLATVIEVKRENNVLTSKIDFNSSDSHGIESAASSEGNKRWHGDTHNIDQFSLLVPE